MSQEHNDTILSEVLSASIGGAVSASILYPLEVLKTRIQAADGDDDDDNNDKVGSDKNGQDSNKEDSTLARKKKVGMLEYARRLYEKEGLQVYVNGIETSAFQSSIEKAFYFFAYTALKNAHGALKQFIHGSSNSSQLSASTNLLLGCLAEWAHLPVTMPIDCLTTAIQTSQKQNAFALMLTILKEGNMYKGIQAYYVLCFKPALQYTVFEQVKSIMLRGRKKKALSAPESFVLGMVARTVATVAVFPFVRAKVVMQIRNKKASTSEPGGKPVSVMAILADIYKADGIAGLYQGLGPELTRGVFSAALMLMIKEQLNGGIKTLLYGPPPPPLRK